MFFLHYLVFGQFSNTIYYAMMSICGIPLNILAVSLVFENLINYNNKQQRLSKVNMLVSLFFSEAGYEILSIFTNADGDIDSMKLNFDDLQEVKNKMLKFKHKINFEMLDFEQLRNILITNRDVITDLMGNEYITEHGAMSDLLMSLMHLRDEALISKDKELTDAYKAHLKNDCERVYEHISILWVEHLIHLKKNYPYQYILSRNSCKFYTEAQEKA